MKDVKLYVIIGISALSVMVISAFFVPTLLQQITYFPEDDPCTLDSCAEHIIANCQPSHIALSSGGALASTLRVNVTGWDGQGNCKLGMWVEQGEQGLNPPRLWHCSIPKDELQYWDIWNPYASLGDVESFRTACELVNT